MKLVKGNLLDMADAGEFDIIVHGCNCFNAMGSGIAKQIKERYPYAYSADKSTEMGNIDKLGTYTLAKSGGAGRQFIIVNAYTQFDCNRVGLIPLDKFEYESFRLILRKLSYHNKACRFGFPMIGMGLAGGQAQEIMKILQDFALVVEDQGGSVTVVEYA
jgi:O-acetyl-ADP-ribose deacetylase (regulator of RNase III)